MSNRKGGAFRARQGPPRRGTAKGGMSLGREINSMTSRVNGPRDPPDVSNDFLMEKTVQILLPVPVTPGKATVTGATIAAHLPVDPTTTTKFRLLKISVWAPAGANNKVQLQMVSSGDVANGGDDNALFADNGTQGSVRPQIHVRPGLLGRIRWFSSSSIDPLFTLSGIDNTAVEQMVVHVSIQLRSTAPLSE